MALCPYCGAALPVTLDVREARAAQERAYLAELQRVRRPEPLWDTGEALAKRRGGGGWVLWLLLFVAAAAAAAVWARGGFVVP
jgi:hypothetical protein